MSQFRYTDARLETVCGPKTRGPRGPQEARGVGGRGAIRAAAELGVTGTDEALKGFY